MENTEIKNNCPFCGAKLLIETTYINDELDCLCCLNCDNALPDDCGTIEEKD